MLEHWGWRRPAVTMATRWHAMVVALVLACAVSSGTAYRTRSSKDAVLLEDVKTLTLRHGQRTAARRGRCVRLVCARGSLRKCV